MTKDIILAGVSINDLKAKKEAIRQEASKFISDAIEQVTVLVKQIVNTTVPKEIHALAEEAYGILENADVVAGVSGVSFLLPYYEEYGGYGSDEILSAIIEETDNDAVQDVSDERGTGLYKLYNLLGGMEAQSRDWHSSRC